MRYCSLKLTSSLTHPKEKTMTIRAFRFATAAALAVSLALPAVTWADPPSHAPAHGWRKKHDPYYEGYSGKKWDRDYGVIQGRCHREAVGAAVGGVVGGAIGSTIGQGDGRTVAIIVGSILGAAVGASVGRDMDEADRACLGQSLELARRGQRVAWEDPSGVRYLLTPTRDFQRDGRPCRDFDLQVQGRGRETVRRTACTNGKGEWRVL
jgi:surface antigen